MPLNDKYVMTTLAYNSVFSNPDIKFQEGMFFLIGKKNNNTIPRLGITIKKRDFKLAVKRNALKRSIKVSFKQVSHKLPALDYVIIVKASQADKEVEREMLRGLWQKCLKINL